MNSHLNLETIWNAYSGHKHKKAPPFEGFKVVRTFTEDEYELALKTVGNWKDTKTLAREIWLYDTNASHGRVLCLTEKTIKDGD